MSQLTQEDVLLVVNGMLDDEAVAIASRAGASPREVLEMLAESFEEGDGVTPQIKQVCDACRDGSLEAHLAGRMGYA